MAYAIEFLIALIAVFTVWSQVGGQGHMDLLPWYIKLGCSLSLAWCSVRFTAALVEHEKDWNQHTMVWFTGIIIVAVAMGGITYYYHLHEVPDEISDQAATLTEPLAAACEILEQINVARGTRVAIVGDGRLGLLVAQVLKHAGAEVTLIESAWLGTTRPFPVSMSEGARPTVFAK